MQNILIILCKNNEKTYEFKSSCAKSFACLKSSNEDLKKDSAKALADLNSNMAQFKIVKEAD